jgi:TPR repeat protein
MRALGLALLVTVGVAACDTVYRERPSTLADSRIQRGKDDLSRGDRAAALAHYEAAAATGDPFGEYKAAQLHAGGPRAERDEERAVELLRRAVADRSDVRPEARALLGRLIADEAPEEALALFRAADEAGADVPPGEMAQLLIAQGFDGEAERWLAEGRAEDDVIALRLSIARALDAGADREAERYATQLAGVYRDLLVREGKIWAAWELARLYDDGEALPRDRDEAIRWYTVAAEAGTVRAVRRLTRGFLQGHDGFPVDAVGGRRWGERGVALGDVASTAYLGRALLTGEPLERDAARGEALLQTAAAAGHSAAMTDLGRAYLSGDVLEQDVARGLRLLEAAAAADNASALTTLGWAYWNGDGVDRNPDRARRLMRQAQALGHPSAAKFFELFG